MFLKYKKVKLLENRKKITRIYYCKLNTRKNNIMNDELNIFQQYF